MWKLGRGRVLLDEPPEDEDGLAGGPPPAAAAAAAQVRGAQVGAAQVRPGPRRPWRAGEVVQGRQAGMGAQCNGAQVWPGPCGPLVFRVAHPH